MLPEFKIDEYDYKKAKQDFKKSNSVLEDLSSFFDESDLMQDLSDAPVKFKEWFEENKENYKLNTPRIRKYKYNFNKSPKENGLKARNNLLIDMMWGVLTNEDTASKILNPGGFDYQKKAARIVSILNSNYEADLRRELGIAQRSIISKLTSMSLKELDSIVKKTKKQLDPLSPTTQVKLHQQNMTGAKLISIYANHNANHALMQHTKLGLHMLNGSFILNGKRLTSLHDIANGDKELISKNNAGFLAASVDNVKDPVLDSINQNTFTADASMLLSRLGYNPIEIGLLMTQPIVIDITQAYFRKIREGRSKDSIIDEILTKYKKDASMMEEITYDNYKDNKFLIEDLANNILIAKEMDGITSAHQTSGYSKVEFYKKQVSVGYLFKRIMKTADSLGRLVQATRADTDKGGAGPTIADTMIKIQKVQDFLKDMTTNEKFPLVDADVISDSIPLDSNEDELRAYFLDSKLPFLQAFYTLGLKQSEKMLGKYFPQFNESFNYVVEALRNMTKTGRLTAKTLNNIYNDLLAYIMSKNEFFSGEILTSEDPSVENKIISSSDRRRYFINNFPTYFKEVLEENEEIANLEFIKRLKTVRANSKNPVDTLVFKNVGHLTSILKERYIRDWESLLYMSNPKAQELALNLFRYSYYRNGFAFGPTTFIHLAPSSIRYAIPEYIETLRSLTNTEDDYSFFVEQYVYNHLDNRQFVPEVTADSSVSFVEKDGKIKDEITFIIDKDSSFGDKKIIRVKTDTPAGPRYEFFDFIARREKDNYVYYKLTENVGDAPNNVAVYSRIESLGFKNSFIEYEYGKEASEMTSVIEKNSKNYNSDAIDPDPYDSYDPSDSYEPTQLPEDDYYHSEQYKESFTEDALRQSYKEIFEEELDTPGKSDNDITHIDPNIDFTDDNNDPLCNLPTLSYL